MSSVAPFGILYKSTQQLGPMYYHIAPNFHVAMAFSDRFGFYWLQNLMYKDKVYIDRELLLHIDHCEILSSNIFLGRWWVFAWAIEIVSIM